MANIDNIKDIVDTFYKIKKGIKRPELYALCNSNTSEEVDTKVEELIQAGTIKEIDQILKPSEV